MKKTIFVIDDVLAHFKAIKAGLGLAYNVLPEENFAPKLYEDPKLLYYELNRLFDENEDEASAIILDVNLKDHKKVKDDRSGLNEILPAIRNKGKYYSIIPIIILTQHGSMEKNALNNLGNYFIEKDLTNLEVQVGGKIRWVLSSLIGIFQDTKDIINNIKSEFEVNSIEELNRKIDVILSLTNDAKELFDLFLPKIMDEMHEEKRRAEIILYY